MFHYFNKARDQISSYTHFCAAVVSIIIAGYFIIYGLFSGADMKSIISCAIFALSAACLYFASFYYHFIPANHEHYGWFRKLDHSMIYVLIAGSYTPITLYYLDGKEGIIFTVIIWLAAILGIIIKLMWMNAPRFLSTLLYLIMGWSIVFYFPAFYSAIESKCLLLIALGGVAYTIGGIIYILKKPNISKLFGFHELFHCFIMIGTLFHFIAVGIYIL